MSLSVYFLQLIKLTNGDVLGDAPEKAVENRMALIRQVFPGLPEKHKEIFEVTEWANLRRQVTHSLGAMSDEMINQITDHCAHTLKIQRLNQKINQTRNVSPPSDLDWDPF